VAPSMSSASWRQMPILPADSLSRRPAAGGSAKLVHRFARKSCEVLSKSDTAIRYLRYIGLREVGVTVLHPQNSQRRRTQKTPLILKPLGFQKLLSLQEWNRGARERNDSVIGFVQAPRKLAVDGSMAPWYQLAQWMSDITAISHPETPPPRHTTPCWQIFQPPQLFKRLERL